MDGWMDGWTDGWMDGWMYGCMHACMHVCMYTAIINNIHIIYQQVQQISNMMYLAKNLRTWTARLQHHTACARSSSIWSSEDLGWDIHQGSAPDYIKAQLNWVQHKGLGCYTCILMHLKPVNFNVTSVLITFTSWQWRGEPIQDGLGHTLALGVPFSWVHLNPYLRVHCLIYLAMIFRYKLLVLYLHVSRIILVIAIGYISKIFHAIVKTTVAKILLVFGCVTVVSTTWGYSRGLVYVTVSTKVHQETGQSGLW